MTKSVHEGQFDARSFDHRLAAFLAKLAINQRRYYSAIRISLSEGVESILLL
ncbi:hypothetical protein [Pseudomonas sp. PS02290]|uniref:hypothetical protein n=1 Tax=Pseudomonas sp. PS02290 TaxID=2991430 RepID=UPI002499F256|nr:hypothetical protein [Pseudomonas sp. PS02290]